MSAQTDADRLAALELQITRLSARVAALEARGTATPAADPDRAARAHRERLTQCQTTTVRPDCTTTTKGPRP